MKFFILASIFSLYSLTTFMNTASAAIMIKETFVGRPKGDYPDAFDILITFENQEVVFRRCDRLALEPTMSVEQAKTLCMLEEASVSVSELENDLMLTAEDLGDYDSHEISYQEFKQSSLRLMRSQITPHILSEKIVFSLTTKSISERGEADSGENYTIDRYLRSYIWSSRSPLW